MIRKLIVRGGACLAVAACASVALAVEPSTVLFMAGAGSGQGVCNQGVCAQWNTEVWVHNVNDQQVDVEVAFLRRGRDNSDPPAVTFRVGPHRTRAFTDIMDQAFNLDGQFGALRFVSTLPVVVTGRIANLNVQTTQGTGSAGQLFAAQPFVDSIGEGDDTRVIGLSQASGKDAAGFRSNFGVLETSGKGATGRADLITPTGGVSASIDYDLRPFEQLQWNLDTFNAPLGDNLQVRFVHTGGDGRFLPFGSVIGNTAGDPFTQEALSPAVDPTDLVGDWQGHWFNATFGSFGTASLVFDWSAANQLLSTTVDLDGNVFGSSDPGPETFESMFGATGFHYQGTSPWYGDYDVCAGPWGIIHGDLMQPASGISSVSLRGYLGKTSLSLRADIGLSGGSQATSYLVAFPESFKGDDD